MQTLTLLMKQSVLFLRVCNEALFFKDSDFIWWLTIVHLWKNCESFEERRIRKIILQIRKHFQNACYKIEEEKKVFCCGRIDAGDGLLTYYFG